MKAIVFLNAAAGTLAASHRQDEADRIAAAFVREGWTADIRLVDGVKLSEDAARAVADERADVVVAGGGDGTLNAVAGALVGTSKPFGVLPLGTLNHFAKEHAIPFDLDEAVRLITRGQPRDINVGEVNGRCFINFSAIGVYTEVVRHRDAQRVARRRGKWWAMFIAAIKMLVRFPLWRMRLHVDGQVFHRITPFVSLTNNRYVMKAFAVPGTSCLGRDKLALHIAQAVKRFALLRMLVRLVLGTLYREQNFEAICVDRVTIDLGRRKHVRVSLDGEVKSLALPLEYRLRAKDLRVILPRDGATVDRPA